MGVLGFSYHELVIEPNDPVAMIEEGPEPVWWRLAEICLRAAVPLALLGLAAWWVIRKNLGPVEQLAAAWRRIEGGHFRECLPLRGTGDELDELTGVFNAMTERIDASFQRVRDFTLHASHELKTPLALLRADYGELLAEENLSGADRSRFASHLDEIERLTRLVDGLSFLARADAHLIQLKRELIAFDVLLKEAAENTTVLGESESLAVRLNSCPPLTVNGDRHRLRQLLLILCDNAVKYNWPGGEVSFALEQAGDQLLLRMANTGRGIAPSEQPRIFDRFFRGDSAREGAIEGCGLGLSVAHWIAIEHGGSLTFSSDDKLTEFQLRLPVIETADGFGDKVAAMKDESFSSDTVGHSPGRARHRGLRPEQVTH